MNASLPVHTRAAAAALLSAAIFAACGTQVYLSSPSPSGIRPPSGPAGSSTLIPPTFAPTPTPSSLPSPVEPSADLFFAMFGAVPPPFHVSLQTTLSGTPSGTALTEADVDGADYSAQLHVEITGAPSIQSQVIVFDGTGFVADAGSTEWAAYPDYETVPPVNPFLSLDPAAWTEIGPDMAHGGLDHLNSTTWRLPPGSSLIDRLEDVNFDLWLDGEGLPVDGVLTFTLPALDRTSEVGYMAVYLFSRLGEPVVIQPPLPVAPGPSPSGPSPSP